MFDKRFQERTNCSKNAFSLLIALKSYCSQAGLSDTKVSKNAQNAFFFLIALKPRVE